MGWRKAVGYWGIVPALALALALHVPGWEYTNLISRHAVEDALIFPRPSHAPQQLEEEVEWETEREVRSKRRASHAENILRADRSASLRAVCVNSAHHLKITFTPFWRLPEISVPLCAAFSPSVWGLRPRGSRNMYFHNMEMCNTLYQNYGFWYRCTYNLFLQ